MKYLLVTLFVGLSSLVHSADLPISTSPEGAKVYIISPANGETVNKIVTVKFGLQGMGISPAGLDKAKTGHHHLIIDGKNIPAAGKVMGSEVMHFGGGQTEKTIELSSGKHTLQLILGNYLHIPHNPPVMSEKITVFVK
ncbi:ATPases of the AAA+ class [uncultured Candidatus Thioglobus sp.]|nr:ATPases of the AAA+ class [uncultured Candidatus Thioglobus sp.]